MILVDVHAHLDFPEFASDLPAVLARARSAGVTAIIAQGVNHSSNKKVLAIAEKHGIIKPALGLYPLDAPNVRVHESYAGARPRREPGVEETLRFIREHASRIVAIGEVGIDLKESDDKERQVENLTKILRLSHELGKPLIIHSRKAERLVIDLLAHAKLWRVILHCFSGSKSLVKRAVQLGFFLTVPSNAKRSQHFRMVAREVPLSHLLTETDAPFLSPVRGERNEPFHVREAVEVIAEEKGLNPEETARAIFLNYQRLFS